MTTATDTRKTQIVQIATDTTNATVETWQAV